MRQVPVEGLPADIRSEVARRQRVCLVTWNPGGTLLDVRINASGRKDGGLLTTPDDSPIGYHLLEGVDARIVSGSYILSTCEPGVNMNLVYVDVSFAPIGRDAQAESWMRSPLTNEWFKVVPMGT